MAVKDTFSCVLMIAAKATAAAGFKRDRQRFRRFDGNNCALIEFQRNRRSSKDQIPFTINLAVILGDLSPAGYRDENWSLDKSASCDGHIQMRIGQIMPIKEDHWWEINSETMGDILGVEISRNIEEYAIPFLQKYMDVRTVLALWESGKSMGLTEGQRQRFLQELKAKF